MTRIALWGGASLDNVGDRLLARVARTELARRLPEASFAACCPWSDGGDDARTLRVDDRGRWSGSGEFDAIVALGGIWAGPPFRIFYLQVFSLGTDPAAFDPGTWVAWHGVGLVDGTPALDRPEWTDYVRALADRLDSVTVRDGAAADRFRAATGRRPRVVPDPAFALPSRFAAGRRPGRPRIGVAIGAAGGSGRLATRLSDRRYWDRCRWNAATCYTRAEIEAHDARPADRDRSARFLDPVWTALRELTVHADVDLLSVTNMYGDDEVADRGAASVPGARLLRLGPVDADGLSAAFRRYDAVLVSRYHSVVLALRSGVPVVAVDPYWTEHTGTSKVDQLMRGIGAGDCYWTRPDAPDAARALSAAVTAALDTEPDVVRDVYLARHQAAQLEFDGLADRLAAAA